MRRPIAGIHPGGAAASSSSWDAFYSCVYVREQGEVGGGGGSLPLRPRLLFIIHRADLSVGDGALREGTAAGRTAFHPEASGSDGAFLSLLLSVCFSLPMPTKPPFAPAIHTFGVPTYGDTRSPPPLSPFLLCGEVLIHGASADGGGGGA